MAHTSQSTQTAEERLAKIRAKNAEYARRWRQRNPDKEAAIKRRYWEKKLAGKQQDNAQEPTSE